MGIISLAKSIGNKNLLVALVFTSAVAQVATAQEAFFTYKGKAYQMSDLPGSLQQMRFDTDYEHFEKLKRVGDAAVFEMYVDEEVKKSGKTKEKIEEEFSKSKDPSEAEMKVWYEKNKERIPYPFEQIKDEVKKFLINEKIVEKRTKFIDDLKKKGNFSLAAKEPIAPLVNLVTDGYPAKGGASAKVQIVEFADYQCPHCKHMVEPMKKVLAKYKDKIRLVFMDYPINPSGISLTIAHGAVCADQQKKFWEFHYMAFDKQSTLSKDSPGQFAKELKLDEAAFTKCLTAPETLAKVAKSKAEGEKAGITGTPAIFMNGRRANVGHDEEALTKEIEKALKATSAE